MASRKAWLDILTPKQVLFFHPLVESLKSKGFEVMTTSRRYREVEPIAKMKGLELTFVGERGGKELRGQLAASMERERLLLPLVEDFRPEFALSVASGSCARIAFGLAFPHYATNDSPHSTIAGKLSLPLTRHLFTPWIIPYGVWSRYGIERKQITRYRALDPAAWLKRTKLSRQEHRGPKRLLVRVEERYAPYMNGTNERWTDIILRKLVHNFPDLEITALCRYDDQLRSIQKKFGDSVNIPTEVVDGTTMLSRADVFVGMGGTMTAEAALMGVPTVSVFQGELYTEKYLASQGILRKARSPDSLPAIVRDLLKTGTRDLLGKKGAALLASMEDPTVKISKFLANQGSQD
jgi:predicted glycosyltransferase